MFLFFPVLRRGSCTGQYIKRSVGFYSSPSCDGDRRVIVITIKTDVSILPRLATGINDHGSVRNKPEFLFFPVLRRGSPALRRVSGFLVSILPRLATGIMARSMALVPCMFLFFPVLRRGSLSMALTQALKKFLFFPVLRRGSEHR